MSNDCARNQLCSGRRQVFESGNKRGSRPVALSVTDIDTLVPGEAIRVDWSADEYHADRRCISNSRLGVLESEGPAMLRAMDAGQVPKPTRKSTEFGTHTHLAVLEPGEWMRRLAPPRDHANTTAWAKRMFGAVPMLWPSSQAEWNSRRESIMRRQTDPIDIPDEVAAKVNLAAESVRRHRDASELMCGPDGESEVTIVWRPADFPDLLVRCRLDRWIPDLMAIGDLKSTRCPEPGFFGRDVARRGYHRQGAIYVDAARAWCRTMGTDHGPIYFVIVAVRNEPPFEVAIYELKAKELRAGRKAYRRQLTEYSERLAQNDWTASWQRGINRLELPRWAYPKDEET